MEFFRALAFVGKIDFVSPLHPTANGLIFSYKHGGTETGGERVEECGMLTPRIFFLSISDFRAFEYSRVSVLCAKVSISTDIMINFGCMLTRANETFRLAR